MATPQGAGLTIEKVEGGRGVFDVRLDGAMIFSKKIEYRFPTAQDIIDRLPAA